MKLNYKNIKKLIVHCPFCKNGEIKIPEPKYYEAIMFKHNVIADHSWREFVIEIDVLAEKLKIPHSAESKCEGADELRNSVTEGKELISEKNLYFEALFYEAIKKYHPDWK